MQILRDGELVDLTPEEIAERQAADLVTISQINASELLAYMDEFRDMRRELLNVLTGIAIAEDMLEEFRVAREALLNIPQVPEVANATTAEDAKAACKIEYAKIVAAAPLEFKLAFKELNG